jgi:hypothetical protein
MCQKLTVIMETLLVETEENPMASIPAGSHHVAIGSSFGAGMAAVAHLVLATLESA